MTKTFAIAAMATLGVAMAASAQAGDIQSIETGTRKDGGFEAIVKGESLPKPKILRAMQGKVYIAEFAGYLRADRVNNKVGVVGIKSVQFGWYSARPPKARLVFRLLEGSIDPVVEAVDGGWKVYVPGKKIVKPTEDIRPIKKSVEKDTMPIKRDDGSIIPPKLPFGESIPINVKESNLDKVLSKTDSSSLSSNQKVANVLNTGKSAQSALVSLDFVGTDLVQILKALSIQSNVDILAAPEVSPADKPVKLTVSLNRVTLDEALSYVTAISGLRYAKVGKTYIVTPKDTFASVMNSVMERVGMQSDTRVVNLVSGEAAKIKEATLKALPQDGKNGYYEVIVPDANTVPGVTPIGDPADGEKPEGDTPVAAQPEKPRRVYYLMLVGDAKRLETVEDYVRDLDKRITESTSINVGENKGTTVIPIQSGETGRIKQMVVRMMQEHPRASEFSVTESILEGTTKGEAQTMALLMFGPKEELAKMEGWAKSLDKDICEIIGKPYEDEESGLKKVWDVVELNFVEPTLLELELKKRFKGLQVSLMPDAVTPGIKGKTSSTTKNDGATGGPSGEGGQEQSTETQSEERTITGREALKIVLRGTQAQVDEARSYIEMVDQPAKQVALELRVMDLTKEEALRIGIDWNALTGGRLRTWRFNQGLGDTSATSGTITGGTDTSAGGTSDVLNFLATLDQSDNGRNLIARPNALVSDGREASLFVGDTVRYIKTIQSTQSGTTVETGEVNVGVTFDAAVRVGGGGNIALSLDQNFSILTGFTPVPGGGNLPQTSDRRTNMFVNMQSGETLAIGGLILEQDRKRVSGIPILKDLPLIGYLFSRTDNLKQRSEIVFFLTAYVVDQNDRANAANPAINEQMKDPKTIREYQKTKMPKKAKKNSDDN